MGIREGREKAESCARSPSHNGVTRWGGAGLGARAQGPCLFVLFLILQVGAGRQCGQGGKGLAGQGGGGGRCGQPGAGRHVLSVPSFQTEPKK